jgi:hypothetical protein
VTMEIGAIANARAKGVAVQIGQMVLNSWNGFFITGCGIFDPSDETSL